MKILRVISTMAPSSGGPAQGIRNSIPALAALGCDNEVVSLDDPGEEFVTQSSFLIHALGKAKGPWGYHPRLIPWLKENSSRFDIILVHGLWLFPSYAAWKVFGNSTRKPPYFIFPHGMLDPWFQKAPERRWKALRNKVYWQFIEKKVVRDARGLLFTCQEELRLARTSFPSYTPQQEINVGYGIAKPPPYEPQMKAAFEARCPDLQGVPYLLFLSRIHPKKGIDLLIEAYARWSALRRDSFDAASTVPKLVIAGPGLDTAYGQQIQQQVSTLGLAASVHFPGMLAGDVKWGAFYGCEAFVLPSHQENFGIAVVEALGCGKPVLISDQVNIWTEIQEAGAGLVEPDTLEGTLNLLQNWGEMTDEKRRQWTQNIQQLFHRSYNVHEVVKKLVCALESKLPNTSS